jgi:hypothetical protein
MSMRLVAALVIALLPAGALAQDKTTGVDRGANGNAGYGGGSVSSGGSLGYGGPAIDYSRPAELGTKSKAPQPDLGGNYGYDDKSKTGQTR